MVARDGVEPPTPAFSAVFFRANYLFNQQFNPPDGSNYCDHSVTSADVRLSVGHDHPRELITHIVESLCHRFATILILMMRSRAFQLFVMSSLIVATLGFSMKCGQIPRV